MYPTTRPSAQLGSDSTTPIVHDFPVLSQEPTWGGRIHHISLSQHVSNHGQSGHPDPPPSWGPVCPRMSRGTCFPISRVVMTFCTCFLFQYEEPTQRGISTKFHHPNVFRPWWVDPATPDPTPRWRPIWRHVSHGRCIAVSRGCPDVFHDFPIFGTRNPPREAKSTKFHQPNMYSSMGQSGHPGPDFEMRPHLPSRALWY
jgi:hypothetical protein